MFEIQFYVVPKNFVENIEKPWRSTEMNKVVQAETRNEIWPMLIILDINLIVAEILL